jgi:hypothetical protein
MRNRSTLASSVAGLLFTLLVAATLAGSQAFEVIQGPDLEGFLANAAIVRTTKTLEGVAAPLQVLLDLDGVTRFGVFKTIDDKRPGVSYLRGTPVLSFQDSWRTEVAAYRLDKLIELGMVPVTVERVYRRQAGSLQAWAPVAMSEFDRLENKIIMPDPRDWSEQMSRVQIFDNLIYNTDRHMRNIVITEDWKVVLIDHSRSFRPFDNLRNEKELNRFSRSLIESIGRLDRKILQEHLGPYLDGGQIGSIIGRRDRIVERAERLSAERGDGVWFP